MVQQRPTRQEALYLHKGLSSPEEFTAKLNDECRRMTNDRMKLVAALADTAPSNIVEGVWLFFGNLP